MGRKKLIASTRWKGVVCNSKTRWETLFRSGDRYQLEYISEWIGERNWRKWVSDYEAMEWLVENGFYEEARQEFSDIYDVEYEISKREKEK